MMTRFGKGLSWMLPLLFAAACGDEGTAVDEQVDPIDECVFCGDERADAFGIARESYLAYGIVNLANTASFAELDDDVPLDRRAARGIVDQRPFDYIEQVDTVSYVGRTAFANLAEYAQANGYVPFCGDGGLQPLLEACDDGNSVDGDGCSARCEVEETATSSFFAEQGDLIKGIDIGVSLVDPNGYYLRERTYQWLDLPEDVEAILDRADGIIANSAANDRVSFDELALLSKEPFYSALFQHEKDALEAAWEIFEVNTADPATIEWTHGRLSSKVPFEAEITRVGPFVVESTRSISGLDDEGQEAVARRLQNLPGLNADGSASTVEFADVEKGLEDFRPVFTQYEVWELEALHERFIDEAQVEEGGDFVVRYNAMPNQGQEYYELASFDGWTFGAHVTLELHYDAYNPTDSYYSDTFDANLRSEYSFSTSLRYNGRSAWTCSSSLYGACSNPFRYTGVRWMHLDGTSASAGRERGVMLMEHWKNGKRVYNRVVDFKNTYSHASGLRTYHNEYALARPELIDGTPLSLRKAGTKRYGQKEYTRFSLAPVSTVFNKNVEKFFPEASYDFENNLETGRYEEVGGVTLEVHESRAIIAYIDGCEVPLSAQDGYMEGECGSKKVRLDVLDARAWIYVYDGGRKTVDMPVLESYLGSDYLKLDRSNYVVR